MPETVALVDDDQNILTSVSIALEAEGYGVRTFTNGADAYRSLATNGADLIVIDI